MWLRQTAGLVYTATSCPLPLSCALVLALTLFICGQIIIICFIYLFICLFSVNERQPSVAPLSDA